jgi:hypothetical protein
LSEISWIFGELLLLITTTEVCFNKEIFKEHSFKNEISLLPSLKSEKFAQSVRLREFEYRTKIKIEEQVALQKESYYHKKVLDTLHFNPIDVSQYRLLLELSLLYTDRVPFELLDSAALLRRESCGGGGQLVFLNLTTII